MFDELLLLLLKIKIILLGDAKRNMPKIKWEYALPVGDTIWWKSTKGMRKIRGILQLFWEERNEHPIANKFLIKVPNLESCDNHVLLSIFS